MYKQKQDISKKQEKNTKQRVQSRAQPARIGETKYLPSYTVEGSGTKSVVGSKGRSPTPVGMVIPKPSLPSAITHTPSMLVQLVSGSLPSEIFSGASPLLLLLGQRIPEPIARLKLCLVSCRKHVVVGLLQLLRHPTLFSFA